LKDKEELLAKLEHGEGKDVETQTEVYDVFPCSISS
jgi:hypothetical protein